MCVEVIVCYIIVVSFETQCTSTFYLPYYFISGVTALPGGVNIIAIENVIPENIGIAVGIFFYVP